MAEIYLRNGSSVYQARIKIGEETRRISTGKRTPADAQAEADRLEAEAEAEQLQPGDLTLLQAGIKFLERVDLKPRSKQEYMRNLTNFRAVWGDPVMRLVDRKKVNDYVQTKMDADAAPMQLRRDLAFLSSLFTQAIKYFDCGVEINPVKNIDLRRVRKTGARNRWLTREEVQRLIDACTMESHKRFIILAVNTGMRHQELLKLRWEEIDLKARVVALDGSRTKNSCSKEIALSQEAVNTLSNTPKTHREGWVFTGKEGGEPQAHMGHRWNAIRRRAGLPDVRIHDLRHTFASWLKQRGVDDLTLMDLMGHKTHAMVRRYAHNSRASLQTAVSKLNSEHTFEHRSN